MSTETHATAAMHPTTEGMPLLAPLAAHGLAVGCALRRGEFELRASFDVPPGVTVLLGPSGAGKSLTLQSIAGLLTPDFGRIVLADHALYDSAARLNLPTRARHLGYVPQFSALFPHLSVAGNIAYGLPTRRHSWWHLGRAARERAEEAARVEELLALVRLSGYAERMPGTLSGGEAQRVALARALASEPQALLLDEPLSALDAPTRVALRSDLRAVLVASGVPALMVTHDLEEARAVADRLVVLLDGRVVAAGALAMVLATPPTAEAALLLGWGNVLPVAAIATEGDSTRVTLPGGQSLTLPCAGSQPAQAGGLTPQPPLPAGRGGERAASDRAPLSSAVSAQADIVAAQPPSAAVSTAGVPTAGAPTAGASTTANSPAEASGVSTASHALALALRADRLELLAPSTSPENYAPGTILLGRLLSVTDFGPYLALSIGLSDHLPPLRLTCSPREVAATSLVPGDDVRVFVSAEAARLVRARI